MSSYDICLIFFITFLLHLGDLLNIHEAVRLTDTDSLIIVNSCMKRLGRHKLILQVCMLIFERLSTFVNPHIFADNSGFQGMLALKFLFVKHCASWCLG
jgi:hypothetical protein